MVGEGQGPAAMATWPNCAQARAARRMPVHALGSGSPACHRQTPLPAQPWGHDAV